MQCILGFLFSFVLLTLSAQVPSNTKQLNEQSRRLSAQFCSLSSLKMNGRSTVLSGQLLPHIMFNHIKNLLAQQNCSDMSHPQSQAFYLSELQITKHPSKVTSSLLYCSSCFISCIRNCSSQKVLWGCGIFLVNFSAKMWPDTSFYNYSLIA